MSAKWVPHLFTQEQKCVHLDVCETLLTHFEEEMGDFCAVLIIKISVHGLAEERKLCQNTLVSWKGACGHFWDSAEI